MSKAHRRRLLMANRARRVRRIKLEDVQGFISKTLQELATNIGIPYEMIAKPPEIQPAWTAADEAAWKAET